MGYVFPEGSRIRIKQPCSGTKKGEEYLVDRNGELIGAGCTCNDIDHWELADVSTPKQRPLKFSEGESVRCIAGGREGAGFKLGREFVIHTIDYKDDPDPVAFPKTGSGVFFSSLESTTPIKNIVSNLGMNLKEKFLLAFKGEPEKSFIKAGVMNSDESLTTDGKAIFDAFLVKKFGAEFKTEVVDKLTAEEKE